MTRAYGHECFRRNVCFSCQGRLRARRSDSHAEIMYDDGRRAFAAPVCTLCKITHVETTMAPRKLPDFEDRVEALVAHGATDGYAVAQWHKVTMEDGEIRERIYTVLLNGKIMTRIDTCDERRSFQSFKGTGWHEWPRPFKARNIVHFLEKCADALESKGFERQF